MIKGILFDMDGVLLDTERVGRVIYLDEAHKAGYPQMDDELFACLLGCPVQENRATLLGALGADYPYDDVVNGYRVRLKALILGGLCALGMWIFQLPYAIMIGALIGVLALIPIAGAYIGGALGAIMIFSVDPFKALLFIVFLVVLQQVEGNLIYPRTVGSTLHLPGIWVLAAVTIGGAIMGISGMLLFVPLTAAVYRLLGEWVNQQGKPSLMESIASIDDELPAVELIAGTNKSAAAAIEAKAQPSAKPPVRQSRQHKRK